MDFEEYWRNGCFGEYHDIYAKNLAEKFYKAGQQSKQAEIDVLKAKINEAKEEINSFFDNQTQKPTDREYCNKLADIMELLK